jgi:hypothetical protein
MSPIKTRYKSNPLNNYLIIVCKLNNNKQSRTSRHIGYTNRSSANLVQLCRAINNNIKYNKKLENINSSKYKNGIACQFELERCLRSGAFIY